MKVTAIVPVYNEEKPVKGVLEALISTSRINEILVINGGSTDNTPIIINKFKAGKKPKITIINLKHPNEKGGAVQTGSRNIKSDVVLLFDADLMGLKKSMLTNCLGRS